jgi:hypothetical protein
MLRFYPDLPHRRLAALVQDAAFLLVLALLAWIGLRVHDTVDKLAVLGSGVKEVGDNIPLVGGPVKDLGERGENNVHHLANLLGVVTFLIPAALIVGHYLPERLAQIRKLTAAARVLGPGPEPDRLEAVAMRAAFSLPYSQLLRYTKDPLGDLASGRYEALLAAVLDDAGLRGPANRSPVRSRRPAPAPGSGEPARGRRPAG